MTNPAASPTKTLPSDTAAYHAAMSDAHDQNPTPTAEPLSIEHVRKIARLAMLDPGPAELESARTGLSAVLGYVQRLQAAVASDDSPAAPVEGGPVNALRNDAPGPTLSRDVFLKIAPDTGGPDGAYLRIPSPPGHDEGASA